MTSFFLDSSALAKRFVPETGSPSMDYLLQSVEEHRIYLLNIGYAEVVSVFVRKRNAGLISAAQFGNALINLEKEIIKSPGKFVLSFNNSVTTDALALIVKHSINSTDAVLLQVGMDVAEYLRIGGDKLALVSSDQRLLGAAKVEGLLTFNPETEPLLVLAAHVTTN
jgi:predicted nucleic acid-binding protein